VRRTRSERSPHSLRYINQRVDQHRVFHDRYGAQALPRIIRTTEKDHRRQNDAEHQTDLLRLDRGAQEKSERRECGRAEHCDEQHVSDVPECEIGNRSHDETGHRQHEQRGHHALQHARNDLLGRDQPDRNWRKQSVLDLFRPAEVLHHRQRD